MENQHILLKKFGRCLPNHPPVQTTLYLCSSDTALENIREAFTYCLLKEFAFQMACLQPHF